MVSSAIALGVAGPGCPCPSLSLCIREIVRNRVAVTSVIEAISYPLLSVALVVLLRSRELLSPLRHEVLGGHTPGQHLLPQGRHVDVHDRPEVGKVMRVLDDDGVRIVEPLQGVPVSYTHLR